MRHGLLLFILFSFLQFQPVKAQQSLAREWNEIMLEAIRNDFARPTVHARNLWHSAILLYDAWAVFDAEAETYFLGKNIGNYTCNFAGIPYPDDLEQARTEIICYAMFRLIEHRFQDAPGANYILGLAGNKLFDLGYNPYYTETLYQGGDYRALGNYMAQCIIDFGLQDGANELGTYENVSYEPVNAPLIMSDPGNPDMVDPNRWQPLTLDVFIDQSGNEIPFNTPDFLSPEWGQVIPFALSDEDLTVYTRDGFDYLVYHDPGPPPYLDTTAVGGLSEEFKWSFSMVSVWASHLDPEDETLIDISPATIGNIQSYPQSLEAYHDFYNFFEGGEISQGWDINPVTQQPYVPQMVKRGDYGRVLAEFWADGPDSETPPGHWFTIFNYVTDNITEKKFKGIGEEMTDLEWDVKGYFLIGGAMHDVAITSWGIKGWYDYVRPVSAIRYMAGKGQSSDENLPSYHPAGIPLIDGYIELVMEGDTLAGDNNEHVGKIKLYTWKGFDYIDDPETDIAHVGWILAENWWPYQRPSFVTPPFAGYISGHSTYSRAAADVLTQLTGTPFFPGGMGEFECPANEFLVFEEGPSQDITLQWATYQDASDQCSLSRIWGGIHPPVDDIPGRLIGQEIAVDAFDLAESYFYKDEDEDGFYSYEDCDDMDNTVYPNAPELCDGIDNNCNGAADENLTIYTYYLDADQDGYGDAAASVDTCAIFAIAGYVSNDMDCDDTNAAINPDATEVCDGIDNNCSGIVDDALTIYTYYLDADQDGYGDATASVDTCAVNAIAGYVANDMDCDDTDASINPDAMEILNNDIDEDCDGEIGVSNVVDLSLAGVKIFPNPVSTYLHINSEAFQSAHWEIYDVIGAKKSSGVIRMKEAQGRIDMNALTSGLYILILEWEGAEHRYMTKVLRI